MRQGRSGFTTVAALVMTGVIFSTAVGLVAAVSSLGQEAENERWYALADEAAHNGMDAILGYARAYSERYRAMPREWDQADGTIINPLDAFLGGTSPLTENMPADLDGTTDGGNIGVAPAGTYMGWGANRGVLRPAGGAPVVAGAASEVVVSRMGTRHVVTYRPRMVVFEMDDQKARMYRVMVAGRVYRRDPRVAGNYRLAAERILSSTIGREPLSRFASLTDIDLVANFVPGELIDGPTHSNRGYVDFPAGVRPANLTLDSGRSRWALNSPGLFSPVNGINQPIFLDSVTFTYRPNAAFLPDTAVQPNPGPISVELGPGTKQSFLGTGANGATMFRAPDNQGAMTRTPGGGRVTGPKLLADPIPMPRDSANRLGAALGPNAAPNALPWANLEDGLYVTDGFGNVAGGVPVGGGIYIRGNVLMMRASVRNSRSAMGFTVEGNVGGNHVLRHYVAVIETGNNPTPHLELFAWPSISAAGNFNRSTIETQLSNRMGQVLVLGSVAPGGGVGGGFTTNFNALANMQVDNATQTFQSFAPNPDTTLPFNGLIFVDWARRDPIRGVPGPGNPGNGQSPGTGNIFALGAIGDPSAGSPPRGFLKQAVNNTISQITPQNWMTGAEIFNTELPNNRVMRLNIIARGHVYIQNHLLVQGVVRQVNTAPDPATAGNNSLLVGLNRDRVQMVGNAANGQASSRDLLGIVADRQILLGLGCPGVPNDAARNAPGLVTTAALAALGDPSFRYSTNTTDPIPVTGSPAWQVFAQRGSLYAEGTLLLRIPNSTEDYGIKRPNGLSWTATNTPTPDRYIDGNPLYANWPMPLTPGRGITHITNNPNVEARGKYINFGSLVWRKRGLVGIGNRGFDKGFRFDGRLLSIAPPLFPNTVRVVAFDEKIVNAKLPPYAAGSEEDQILTPGGRLPSTN